MVPEKLGWRKEAKRGHWKHISILFFFSMHKHVQYPSGRERETPLSGSFRFCMRRRYCFILHYKRSYFFKLTIPPPTLCKSSLFTIYSCRLQYLVETSREKFRHWKALRRPTELECFFQRGKKSANVYVLAYVPKRASWTAHKQLPFRNNKSPCQKSRDRRLRTNNNFALTQQFLSEDLRVLYKH